MTSPFHATSSNLHSTYTLPWLLATPLAIIPSRLHSVNMTLVLNRLFSSTIQRGELDFLQGRVIALKIRDAGIEYRLTFSPDGFRSVSSQRRPDLTMSGTVYDFLLLATRREDPDTLFFHRRLRIDGNAELGLYVKNFLDGLDWDPAQLPFPIRVAFSNVVPVYEWVAGLAGRKLE